VELARRRRHRPRTGDGDEHAKAGNVQHNPNVSNMSIDEQTCWH
jgi:hypothetical protein